MLVSCAALSRRYIREERAEGLSLDHIHHQTDDLATWLAEWIAERSNTGSVKK